MCEENTSQKERFLQEVEQKLLRRELDARLLENGLVHVRWNEKPLCSVDRDGIVRFRPADITGPEVDRQLRTVIQAAGQVKEYMRIFERAPALKAVGLEDTYKVLADFGDAVLAGQLGKKGARFVTWEWDFDRQGVHAGHYFMENYEAAKQDFAVRAGLVERQRLFSDEQLAVIRNACAFALEDDATLSYAEEKQLHSVQEQIELLLPQQERNQHPTMEQTMKYLQEAEISFRSLGFFAFREEFHETQSRRILAAAFPRAAAAVAPRSAANDTVQLVSARGPVSVYAPGSDLLAQQWRVYLHGYAEN